MTATPAQLEAPTVGLAEPFVLHTCRSEGCNHQAFAARCERHMTDEDRATLAALDRVRVQMIEAEERWLALRAQTHSLESEAGIRRAPAGWKPPKSVRSTR